MPMVDLYAPEGMFPTDSYRQLAVELTEALHKAQGLTSPNAYSENNTAAYIHILPPGNVHTSATDSAKVVRVQFLFPPGGMSPEGAKGLVKESTEIVAKVSGDATQADRTWVLITTSMEGGWGISGEAMDPNNLTELWTA